MRKAPQSCIEYFIDRFKIAARELLPDDLFVFGSEFHGHNSNLRESTAQRKRDLIIMSFRHLY